MKQLITPNPDIPCKPGWCLQYVRETYGLPARYGSASEAWEKSSSQHADWNFPEGVWIPVWFSIDTVPEGHVALKAPDGSVYSSSDLGDIPHHHASIGDLEAYYAYYGGMTLTYLGWTEDVASYPVVGQDTIQVEQAPTVKDEFDMASIDDLVAVITRPDVLDAIALAILHRECALIDPTGKTQETVTQTTTLGKKVNWAAYNNARLLDTVTSIESGLQELHTVVNQLLPDGAHALPAAPSVVPVAQASVNP